MTFAQKVLQIVAGIPKGKTMTYCQVAGLAGNPKAARAVGTIISKNYNPAIPCHRVIRIDGKLGGYNRGIATKAAILAEERTILIEKN
jgi:methylated-DNA-[protein]-cysteine S-methyltransferase